MAERARTLKVGGILLAIVVAGLIVGFLLVGRNGTSPGPGGSTSPTADVKAQVETAYLRAWDVWADALRRLDASGLPEAMTGDALRAVTQQVDDARRKNEPIRIEVEHKYSITLVDAVTASVDDNYINHSVRLDPKTGQATEPVPNKRVHKSFTMKLVNGTWRLAQIIGFES